MPLEPNLFVFLNTATSTTDRVVAPQHTIVLKSSVHHLERGFERRFDETIPERRSNGPRQQLDSSTSWEEAIDIGPEFQKAP